MPRGCCLRQLRHLPSSPCAIRAHTLLVLLWVRLRVRMIQIGLPSGLLVVLNLILLYG